MKVELNDGSVIYVKWEHAKKMLVQKRRRNAEPVELEQRITRCLLFPPSNKGETVEPIESAEITCYFKDSYNKNKGRIRALALALKNMDYTKEQRLKFWEAYRKMRHGVIGEPDYFKVLNKEGHEELV